MADRKTTVPKCSCGEDLRGVRVIYFDKAFGGAYCSLRCARYKFLSDTDDIILQLWELHKYEHLDEIIQEDN